MKKNVTKKIFYSAAATAVFAGSAVTGVGAIANADDDIKQFDKESIVGGEHVNDAEAYPYSADPYPSSSEYPSSTSPAPSETPTPTPEKPSRENFHAVIEGSGAVNCNSGEACIDPETGIAHVEYRVQATSGDFSDPHTRNITSDRAVEIAIPNVLKNVKVEIESYYPGKLAAERAGVDREVINVGTELPIYVNKDSDLADGGYNTFDGDSKNKILNDQGFKDLEYSLHNAPVSFGTFEDITIHESTLATSRMTLNGNDESAIYTDALQYVDAEGNEARFHTTPNAPLYNFLTVPSGRFSGLYTYTISGDVEVDSDVDEIYLPMRAEQKSWACPKKENLFGSYQGGCQDMKELSWARNGSLPFYDLKDPKVNEDLARRNTANGLDGSPYCAVTRETGLPDKIGEDVTPRNLRRVLDRGELQTRFDGFSKEDYDFLISEGYELDPGYRGGGYDYEVLNDFDPVYSVGDRFADVFKPRSNPDVDYYVAGYGVDEDGCDQAAIKLTWCPDEEETPTPSPSDTPVVPEPSPSDEPTPSSEVTSSEPPMPSDEPTSSEEPTPETTPRETPTIPEPEPRETPDTPVDTPSTTKPAARIVPSSPAPVITPPAVNHTFPEKQPAPENPSRVNNPPFVPAPAPVQPAAIPGPVSEHGPVVNTGGAVQESFWTKIANIFR